MKNCLMLILVCILNSAAGQSSKKKAPKPYLSAETQNVTASVDWLDSGLSIIALTDVRGKKVGAVQFIIKFEGKYSMETLHADNKMMYVTVDRKIERVTIEEGKLFRPACEGGEYAVIHKIFIE